jgi:outer membrane protein assembly factor BamB
MKRLLPPLLLLFGCAPLVAAPAPPDKAPTHLRNWSSWRGPEQSGVSRERDLPDTWSLKAGAPNSNLIWRAPYGGSTTPIVQGGRIYFPGKVGEGETQQERVVCLDENDGKLLHEFKSHVFLTDIVSDRIGWTNLAGDPETGNVFVHFTSGLFYCLDKDLKPLWSHSLTEDYGRISGYGGRLTTPVVDGNLVILGLMNSIWGELAMGGCRWVAFDKNTGEVVWWSQTKYRARDTYYSVPVVKVINGERVLVSGGGDGGVHAMRVRTGEMLWSFQMCHWSVNPSPVVDGNLVYIAHGEQNDDGTSGEVFCLDASKIEKGQPKVVWVVKGIKAKFTSPVLHDGMLYITNDGGELYCLDAKTGAEVWTYVYGTASKGSPLWADGKIYIGEFDSRFHILQPSPTGCTELHSQFFKGKNGVTVSINGSPVAVNGHVYFMTSAEFYCLGKKDHKAAPDAILPEPQEPPVVKSAKPNPGYLQIVPADVTLTPGDSQAFKAYAFDDHGRALGEVKVDWAPAPMLPPVWPVDMPPPPPPAPGAKGPPDLKGKVEPANGTETKLTVAGPTPPLQFGELNAQLGDLKAHARIRVAPKLPFVADFTKVPLGRTPAGWVNTQGKYSMVMFGGKEVLMKRNDNPNPLVARVNAYIGAPNLSDYTIQSDVYGTQLRADLPDMGVGANRYTLAMLGNQQQLTVGDWDAQSRADSTIAFPWKPDVWYTMKLTVTVKGGKAEVRGKVWPRGAAEPAKWTIELNDPLPEKEGSPFLFGNATGAVDAKNLGTTVYYDNVRVTPNK